MELVLDEGRVYGARYYTVKPEFDWWAPGSQQNNIWRDMIEWCVETYGPSAKDGVMTPGQRWYANNAKFWFREPDDLMMFVLKWSG
jgi:hypothetical protein